MSPPTVQITKHNHLWGILLAETDAILNVELWKVDPIFTIGRNASNNVVLDGERLGQVHCSLFWDGKNHADSLVKVTDQSENGTYINGVKIGAGHTAILRNRDIVAFDFENPTGTDYRYTFFLMAAVHKKATRSVLNGYDVCHRLGRGSFGTVILGVKKNTGSKHAIKIVEKTHFKLSDDEARKQFLREVQILNKVNHPNICGFLKSIDTKQRLYIILEYVEGGSLETFMEARPCLSEKLSHHLTLQMTKALSYLHLKKIVHRDLKPDNILLTKDNPPNVKLADFGLSKATDTMSQLKTLCGTPLYIAPEVLSRPGPGGYTHLVDSWALGIIVFNLLTKYFPFENVEDIGDPALVDERQHVDWIRLESVGASENAISFVKRLIVLNESRRMSATDALSHPWLGNKIEPVTKGPTVINSDNKDFRRRISLKEAAPINAVLETHSRENLVRATGKKYPVLNLFCASKSNVSGMHWPGLSQPVPAANKLRGQVDATKNTEGRDIEEKRNLVQDQKGKGRDYGLLVQRENTVTDNLQTPLPKTKVQPRRNLPRLINAKA